MDEAVGSSGDLVSIAVNYSDWNSRICEADLSVGVGIINKVELSWDISRLTFQGSSMLSGRTRRPAHSGKTDSVRARASSKRAMSRSSGMMCAVLT